MVKSCKLVVGLFDDAVVDNQYEGEDFAFCRRWRALGGEVWVDMLSPINHTGLHTFAGRVGKDFGWVESVV